MKELIIFIIGLHNKPQGCGTSVASAAGHFTRKNNMLNITESLIEIMQLTLGLKILVIKSFEFLGLNFVLQN
jgi:hypothetical protein